MCFPASMHYGLPMTTTTQPFARPLAAPTTTVGTVEFIGSVYPAVRTDGHIHALHGVYGPLANSTSIPAWLHFTSPAAAATFTPLHAHSFNPANERHPLHHGWVACYDVTVAALAVVASLQSDIDSGTPFDLRTLQALAGGLL